MQGSKDHRLWVTLVTLVNWGSTGPLDRSGDGGGGVSSRAVQSPDALPTPTTMLACDFLQQKDDYLHDRAGCICNR